MGGLVPLLFVVLALYGSAAAQDSPLVWERVGSVEDAKWLVFYGDTLYTVQYTTQPPTAVLRPGSDDFSRAFAGSVYAYGLLHLSPDTMLTRNLSNVYRTTDGGGSWEKVIDTGTFSNPVETPSGAVLVGTRGNADGHGALVLRSADRGATWTFHGLGNEAGIGTEHVLVVPPSPERPAGRLVAAGFNGIAYSDDDGVTWTATAVYAPLGYDVPGAVRVPGSGRLLAITQPNGASGAILGSDDDGTTWAPVGTAPGVSPFSSRLVAAPDGAVYLYENHGDADDRHGRPVWRSTDGGASWEDVGPVWTEWSAVPQRVAVGPDGRLWAAAEGRPGWDGVPLGGVFRTVDPVYAVAGESESERAQAGVGLRVSPNPTRGAATVTVVLASPTRVRVSVVDAVGREVAVVHDGPAADGQRFAVETAGLPAGAYRVRVRIAGGAVASAGLIVAR